MLWKENPKFTQILLNELPVIQIHFITLESLLITSFSKPGVCLAAYPHLLHPLASGQDQDELFDVSFDSNTPSGFGCPPFYAVAHQEYPEEDLFRTVFPSSQ